MTPHRMLASVVVWMLLFSQAPTELRLRPSTARLEVEFSDLSALRELRDGRVLLFDRKESQLYVVDFRDGSVRKVGRTGQGPGEYQIIVALLPLGGDSTLAADLSRWLVLDGADIVATLPPDSPAVRAVALFPLGADRYGACSRSLSAVGGRVEGGRIRIRFSSRSSIEGLEALTPWRLCDWASDEPRPDARPARTAR